MKIVCVFFKILAFFWWVVLGSIITAVGMNARNWFVALGCLVALSIWVALSCTAVHLNNEKWIEKNKRK